jgi:hypothetical protein
MCFFDPFYFDSSLQSSDEGIVQVDTVVVLLKQDLGEPYMAVWRGQSQVVTSASQSLSPSKSKL